MRTLLYVYIVEVAQDHAQNAPLIKNWARSWVQAAERDLMLAYLVIDVCDKMDHFVL